MSKRLSVANRENAILFYLSDHPSPAHYTAIAMGLLKEKPDLTHWQIHETLSKLAREGRITRTQSGWYVTKARS